MAKSINQCRIEAEEAGHQPGSPDFDDYVENCIMGGKGGKQPPGPAGSPCQYGGSLGQQVKDERGNYRLLKPCKSGYKPIKAADGRIWCCLGAVPGDENGNGNGDENGNGNGDVDENCYKLAESPIAAQGGQLWTDDAITAEMGFYRNPAAQGHWLHKNGKWYLTKDIKAAIKNNTLNSLQGVEGGACKKGYKKTVKDGVAYCCPAEGGTPGETPGGEFKWSPELMKLIESLRGRYEYLMKYPRGTSPEERQSIINYMVSGIKRGERGEIQSMKDRLARVGLIGQPAEIGEVERIERGTRELTSKAKTEVGIDELDRRYREMIGTTGLAGNLMSILLGTEQVPEVLSSARRSEQKDYMAMLLQYLSTIMGGSNSYWQAILNYMSQGEGGSDFSDWLPYMGYYLT